MSDDFRKGFNKIQTVKVNVRDSRDVGCVGRCWEFMQWKLCRYMQGEGGGGKWDVGCLDICGGLMRCRLFVCESQVDFDHYAVVLLCFNAGRIKKWSPLKSNKKYFSCNLGFMYPFPTRWHNNIAPLIKIVFCILLRNEKVENIHILILIAMHLSRMLKKAFKVNTSYIFSYLFSLFGCMNN